jgi:hypothetical protein
MNMGLGETRSCSGHSDEENSLLPLPGLDRDRPAHIQSQYKLNSSAYLSGIFQVKATDHKRIYHYMLRYGQNFIWGNFQERDEACLVLYLM